jgi:hypothetical protein
MQRAVPEQAPPPSTFQRGGVESSEMAAPECRSRSRAATSPLRARWLLMAIGATSFCGSPWPLEWRSRDAPEPRVAARCCWFLQIRCRRRRPTPRSRRADCERPCGPRLTCEFVAKQSPGWRCCGTECERAEFGSGSWDGMAGRVQRLPCSARGTRGRPAGGLRALLGPRCRGVVGPCGASREAATFVWS